MGRVSQVGPEVTAVSCPGHVLSQMGMLRLMQAGCRARLWVLYVAHDLVRLGTLELGVSERSKSSSV